MTHIPLAALAMSLALAALMPSCAGKPPPEAEWNRVGIWHRVSDDPPTYVPKGYAASRPRTDSHGEWFTDKRDGKRVFVPHEHVGEFRPYILAAEARKVTRTTRPTTAPSVGGTLEDTASGVLKVLLEMLAAMGHR